MKTDVFKKTESEKLSPDALPQGFVVHWDIKTGKRQMWIWGFPNIKPEDVKMIVAKTLEDILKS